MASKKNGRGKNKTDQRGEWVFRKNRGRNKLVHEARRVFRRCESLYIIRNRVLKWRQFDYRRFVRCTLFSTKFRLLWSPSAQIPTKNVFGRLIFVNGESTANRIPFAKNCERVMGTARKRQGRSIFALKRRK